MEEVKTNGKCVVCEGEIVEIFERHFDARMGPMIIGPGSKHQFHEVSEGFHCKGCGLKYAFIPPKSKNIKRDKR